MKPRTLLFFSFPLFLMYSCKKDYVCECTYSPTNVTIKATIKGVSKKTAKDACVSRSYQYVDDSSTPPTTITVNENCSIK